MFKSSAFIFSKITSSQGRWEEIHWNYGILSMQEKKIREGKWKFGITQVKPWQPVILVKILQVTKPAWETSLKMDQKNVDSLSQFHSAFFDQLFLFLSNGTNRIRFRKQTKKKINYCPPPQATTINNFLGIQMYSVHI